MGRAAAPLAGTTKAELEIMIPNAIKLTLLTFAVGGALACESSSGGKHNGASGSASTAGASGSGTVGGTASEGGSDAGGSGTGGEQTDGGGSSSAGSGTAGNGDAGACGGGCRSGLRCCTGSSCSACLPTAEECSALVCSPNGAGYDPYPSDCTRRVSGDPTFCMTTAGKPHAYACDSSVLSDPCVTAQIAAKGGIFCCP